MRRSHCVDLPRPLHIQNAKRIVNSGVRAKSGLEGNGFCVATGSGWRRDAEVTTDAALLETGVNYIALLCAGFRCVPTGGRVLNPAWGMT